MKKFFQGLWTAIRTVMASALILFTAYATVQNAKAMEPILRRQMLSGNPVSMAFIIALPLLFTLFSIGLLRLTIFVAPGSMRKGIRRFVPAISALAILLCALGSIGTICSLASRLMGSGAVHGLPVPLLCVIVSCALSIRAIWRFMEKNMLPAAHRRSGSKRYAGSGSAASWAWGQTEDDMAWQQQLQQQQQLQFQQAQQMFDQQMQQQMLDQQMQQQMFDQQIQQEMMDRQMREDMERSMRDSMEATMRATQAANDAFSYAGPDFSQPPMNFGGMCGFGF